MFIKVKGSRIETMLIAALFVAFFAFICCAFIVALGNATFTCKLIMACAGAFLLGLKVVDWLY